MTTTDLPIHRIANAGPRALTDAEVLALILGGSASDLAKAQGLLDSAGSLHSLVNWELPDLEEHGLLAGKQPAYVVAAYELARRLREQSPEQAAHLNEPSKIWKRMEPLACGLGVEKCWVLSLNRRNKLLAVTEISSGTATSALLHPREVFRTALRHGATALVVCHNHPSGDPTPSPADRAVTRQLADAGRTMGIELLDHVIIGRPESDPAGKGWFSFGEAGLI